MDVCRASHHYPPLVYQDAEGREAILAAQAYFEAYERATMDQKTWSDDEDGYFEGDAEAEAEDKDKDAHQGDDSPSNTAELADDTGRSKTYDYQGDSLLRLIVDVQSYLTDINKTGVGRTDRPLLELQYKMYTYLKQRAYDLGFDANALF